MRRPFLDNARNTIVLLVVLYHIAYIFNSVGVITNINVQGIKAVDIIEYLLYPWFMCCLFLIGGISAEYALEKISAKQFLKKRVKRLLVPSVCGIFIYGWFSGYVTSLYADMFAGNGDSIPGIIKYFVYCMAGIGPLWFAHELFFACLVLLIIRRIDKKGRLLKLGGRANMPAVILLVLAVWGSAQILNTPLIEVYRNGIYILFFLLGYYVFSHDNIQELLARYCIPLLVLAAVSEVVFTVIHFGDNYSAMTVLKEPLTNACAWFGTLAVLGAFKKWGDREVKLTCYLNKRNFGIYALHYPLLIAGFMLIRDFGLPVWSYYIILLVWEIITVPLAFGLISRIPVLRFLILGISKKKVSK